MSSARAPRALPHPCTGRSGRALGHASNGSDRRRPTRCSAAATLVALLALFAVGSFARAQPSTPGPDASVGEAPTDPQAPEAAPELAPDAVVWPLDDEDLGDAQNDALEGEDGLVEDDAVAEDALDDDAPEEDDPLEREALAREAETIAERRVRFTGFPFVFYLPETSFGFGFGLGVSALTRAPPEGSPIRWFPSSLTVGGAYTLNNQLRFLLTPELYLRQGKIVVDGQTEMRFYPDRFYGLGRATDTSYQPYTDVTFRTSTAIRYQVRPGIYVGGVIDAAVTRLHEIADQDTDENPRPAEPSNQWLGTGGVPGDRNSRVFGIGPTFVFDNRDFPLMSRQGYFLRALVVGFPSASYRFVRTLLDARMYFPFANGEVVLAAQWVMSAVGGHAPFNHLASVGGPIGLRSYPDGRFRDAMQTFTQVELRFPIVWRFRGAVHVGTGHVFGPESRDDPLRVLWAAGVGLRLVLIPERRLLVRGDVVLGPEGVRILAFVNEAF